MTLAKQIGLGLLLGGIFSAGSVWPSLWPYASQNFLSVNNSLHQVWEANDTSHGCMQQQYTVELISIDPLMIYVNNFLSQAETEHLVREGTKNYTGRRTNGDDRPNKLSPKSYSIPKADPIVKCVGQRALKFLGFLENEDFEEPWVVLYRPGQKFGLHVESAQAPYAGENGELYNKLATFFVYLEADCVGGETYYPLLGPVPSNADGNKFSRTTSGKGLVFRPVRGNAIFWLNNHRNGSVHESTAHMGLPITEGRKIGMNIFTKQRWNPDAIEPQPSHIAGGFPKTAS